jgi:hypothetical protein
MFPLLPAILLLLLNGSSGLDRTAYDGCLPEAIKALHRQINEGDSEKQATLLKGLRSELIIASLLAGSNDEQLSQAISELLMLVGMSDLAPPPRTATFVDFPEPDEQLALGHEASPRLNEGFSHTARSRDGPASC